MKKIDTKKTDANNDSPKLINETEYHLCWEIEHKKKDIIDKAKWLRGELDDLIKHLEVDGRITNSLGVLQGNGPALDRVIGEYATLLKIKELVANQSEAGL